ncbi:MAG: hypothetical protein ACE37B_04090 [Ilumatobacter sp.]|uniref:hypothetical protein n=1 Tax=Ilumatobacter sp. TaxID=1967498 RepID=UPI00391A7556
MRRSLGGLLLLIAAGLFAVSIGAFWLERVAFSPSADTDSTFEILRDEDIRKQIATLVATIDGPVLGMSPVLLSETIEGLTERRAMATEMRRFVAEAHGRVIGDHDDQVVITAAEQVQIVRNEGVALMDPIVLPVEEVGSLSLLSTITRWLWLIGGPLAIVLTLFGLAIRPERGEFSLAFSLGCAATGLMLLVMGYVVPVALLPALSDDVWVGVFPRLAANDLTFTFVGAVMFVAIGALAMFGTSGLRQRRQRSTPLASARYREQQRWSGR